jgi:hypothetical protein
MCHFHSTEYPTPRLICPPNQLLELPENGNKVQVKLQKPKTDVNFKRDITIKPSWIKSEKIALDVGVQNITFTAKHPISKLTVSCTTSIFVVGKFINFTTSRIHMKQWLLLLVEKDFYFCAINFNSPCYFFFSTSRLVV